MFPPHFLSQSFLAIVLHHGPPHRFFVRSQICSTHLSLHKDVRWQAWQCIIVTFQVVRTVKGAVKRLAADLYSTLAWNFLAAVDKSQGTYDFQDVDVFCSWPWHHQGFRISNMHCSHQGLKHLQTFPTLKLSTCRTFKSWTFELSKTPLDWKTTQRWSQWRSRRGIQ